MTHCGGNSTGPHGEACVFHREGLLFVCKKAPHKQPTTEIVPIFPGRPTGARHDRHTMSIAKNYGWEPVYCRHDGQALKANESNTYREN